MKIHLIGMGFPRPASLGVDKETVVNVLLTDSIFVGDGGIPHNPTVGEEPSPNPWNQMHGSVV
jgi:hypothetical protein